MPEVLTHKGFKKYDSLRISNNVDTKLEIRFISGKNLKCTLDHRVMVKNDTFSCSKDLVNGSVLHNNEIVSNIIEYESNELVYDLINVEDTNSYYTNNIVSHNCVFMDEMAHVGNNLAEEFFTSTYPVISSGKSTKIIIVSTPRGMNMFYKMWMDAINKKSEYVPIEIHWSQVPGRDEAWKESTIRNTSARQFEQEFESLGRNTYININNETTTIGELYEKLSNKGAID